MTDPIRILIADDHAVVRHGLRSLLSQYPDLLVVGEVAVADDVVSVVAGSDADVVLLDVRLSPGAAPTGIDLARRLKRRAPRPRIAIMTAFDDSEYVFDAFHAGVDAYILKTVSEDVLADAIRAVAAGQRFVSGPILGSVLSQFEDLARRQVRDEAGLTDDDLHVLRMLADGATTAQIGDTLYWSEPTAKRRLRAIFKRMDVPNRTQAVAEALRRGLI